MVALAVVLVLVAAASLHAMRPVARALPRGREDREDSPSFACVVYAPDRIVRRDARGEVVLVSDDASLGIVRIVERSRHRMIFVFSRRSGTAYLGASLRGAPRDRVERLTRGATLVPDGLLPDALFEPGRAIGADTALELLAEIARRAPFAVDRVVCADAGEFSLDLRGNTLTSGDRRFELDAPFVWRPLAFHELAGRVGAVFQATWVEQGGARVVFVSALPPNAIWRDPFADDREPEPWRTSDPAADARALELVGSAPGDPPPAELRVPVDALLMFPLRAALAGARKAKREHAPWHRRPLAEAPSE